MPYHHPHPKHAECPYCYEGLVVFDHMTKKMCCQRCQYFVLTEEK